MSKKTIVFLFCQIFISSVVIANEIENTPNSKKHSITISSGSFGVIGTKSIEYESQFLPNWYVNTIAVYAKDVELDIKYFDAFGLSIKRSISLSSSWSIYASVGFNKYKNFYPICTGPCDYSSSQNYSSEKGTGAIGSLGADFHMNKQFFLGFRLLLIEEGNSSGITSVDFRLGYRF